MSTKVYKKLIRDKIPKFFAKPNKVFNTKTLSETEFKLALKQKLIEEALELSNAVLKKELIDEIADVTEVISYIKSSENISDDEVERSRIAKKEERGGFDQKLFLESVEEN